MSPEHFMDVNYFLDFILFYEYHIPEPSSCTDIKKNLKCNTLEKPQAIKRVRTLNDRFQLHLSNDDLMAWNLA